MFDFNIKTILVPTDFSTISNNALRHAELLAKATDAEVELLHIVETDVAHTMTNQQTLSGDYYNFLVMEAKVKMKQLAKIFLHERLHVLFNTKQGNPGDKIVETAVEHKSDLIIMGYYNDRDGSELSFRAMNIVRRSPCPIIAVQPEADNQSYHKIVVPLRDHPYIMDKIHYAIKLAKYTGSSIHFVVFYPHYKNSKQNDKVSKLFGEAYEMMKNQQLQVTYTSQMGGDYVRDTLTAAKDQNAHLIVILANQSGFIKRFFGASDEERFMRNSKIPIMTIPVGHDGLKMGHNKADHNDNLNPPAVSNTHFTSPLLQESMPS